MPELSITVVHLRKLTPQWILSTQLTSQLIIWFCSVGLFILWKNSVQPLLWIQPSSIHHYGHTICAYPTTDNTVIVSFSRWSHHWHCDPNNTALDAVINEENLNRQYICLRCFLKNNHTIFTHTPAYLALSIALSSLQLEGSNSWPILQQERNKKSPLQYLWH